MKSEEEKKRDTMRGFQIPEGYFDAFDTRLRERMSGESDRGFKVPEGYFETLEVKNSIDSNAPKVFPLKRSDRSRLFWMTAAASILLFVGLKYMNTGNDELRWEDLDTAEISSWLESDASVLNPYDIAEVYQEVELEPSYASDAEIEAYLNEVELEEILIEN